MFRTLQSRLLVSFLFVSLTGIVLVSLAIHVSFTGSFRDYIDQKRIEQIEGVLDRLEGVYKEEKQFTGESIAMVLYHHAMVDQLFFEIYDAKDELIIDSTTLLRGRGGGMMHQSSPLHQMNLDECESVSFSLFVEEEVIGSVVAYYPREYMNIDSQFLQQFNYFSILTAIVILLMAVGASFFISKKLTSGLRRVADGARELQQHNLNVRIPRKDQVEEINQLATAFNELAESLSKQEKLRKQFTNDLAHELRTPLATLRSQLEAFQDGVWEPTPERLKQSHQELMRLVRLVDDLDKLLAAENPQIQLKKEDLSVNDLLQASRNSFYPLFKEKGIKLVINAPKEDISLHGDRDRIMQIMINLLNNALKYSYDGGQVTLNVFNEKSMIKLVIEDTGQGISNNDLPHIFERFYRGEKSRNRKTGGVGIGLSIVKALVEAHRGKISVESKQGEGTKVTLLFPK
ncbi:ATP-binding protein [Anaerobacillus sp. MEB173]|uniref:sensor histidine kinase n=1 Tax=Anaerobacillus sp. MEB173 TaxID=3383345 RepID=UPI003F91266A